MTSFEERLRRNAATLQRAADEYCATLARRLEASIRVDPDSTPGRCVFRMSAVIGGRRVRQRAHVSALAVQVMSPRDAEGFIADLWAGAFAGAEVRDGAR